MHLYCVATSTVLILFWQTLWFFFSLVFTDKKHPLSTFFKGSRWDCPNLCAVCSQIQDDSSGNSLLFVLSSLMFVSGSCLCLLSSGVLIWVYRGVEDDICQRIYVKMKEVTQGLRGNECVSANRSGIRLLQCLQATLWKFLKYFYPLLFHFFVLCRFFFFFTFSFNLHLMECIQK